MLSRRSAVLALSGLGFSVVGAAQGRIIGYVEDPVLGRLPICGGIRLAAASGAAAAPVDKAEMIEIDLLEKLGLMEGHLRIGRALLQAKMPRDALPHFGHPTGEIYEYLEPLITARQVPAFAAELRALEQRARGGYDAAFDPAYDGVVARINRLRATVPDELARSPRFVLRVLALLAEDVASDYEQALERGRIANSVEYHDAMGFLGYCDDLLASVRPAATGPAARACAKAAAAFKETAAAFPSLAPPRKPAVSLAFVKARAGRVEAAANAL